MRGPIAPPAFQPHFRQNMRNNRHRNPAGFTLVEIMIVVAIIGLLAAMALPNFVRARATSQANACINNLRQLDEAADQFAIENHKRTGDTVTAGDIAPYLKLKSSGGPHSVSDSTMLPTCPAGGAYSSAWSIGENPSCALGVTVTPAHVMP